uniref:Uncharacterized protein n=1 Tax=Avena sativa TaxID=4498 RepID=A0ACD5Z5F1_AVESA
MFKLDYQLMEWNSTVCCNSTNILLECPREDCDKAVVDEFIKTTKGQMWRVDTLLLVNVILAGIIVGIGAYANRYRHYGFTRYLLLGATTLFLPIISYVLSTIAHDGVSNVKIAQLEAICTKHFLHPYLVIVSTGLVLISAINTSPIVATDDRENRSIHPPIELLVQGIWVAYLAATVHESPYYIPAAVHLHYFIFAPFALIHAKMAPKYYAFLKAQKSFTLGRSPRLII